MNPTDYSAGSHFSSCVSRRGSALSRIHSTPLAGASDQSATNTPLSMPAREPRRGVGLITLLGGLPRL